mmetsp:Transcript_29967/g.49465  ORF Transcript_29967/g.49465 Transcript_29967/m.49465 type:complete len:112 (-) Transcript_29967:304-639(-)|eukprot:CAMPEP_0119015202 /NCGR_PEP_ID=MMETSP1176-20130426/10614_1 /TAXON_ID=265551 /ORGANISM="Synedropsis recta cf, Strain CCMP1620" /LENGTH=111 /DNA_ID=CAMNT_0006968475 /DNA_START=29 /DNA_END=364 /DNA_ORIENTATION=-
MNRQPNDRELSSNTNPSSVDVSKVEEPNLKVDTLISSFYATAAAAQHHQQHSSSLSNSSLHFNTTSSSLQDDSSSTLQDDSQSSIDTQDRVSQRMQMTEHYLLKALNLDRS